MKGYLAMVLPPLRSVAWSERWYGVTRNQAYLLFVILNELLLGVETTLAHISNGTVRTEEFIPIIFGPVAAALLLLAYLVGVHGPKVRTTRGPSRVARLVARSVLVASVLVGLLGTYFHLMRTVPFNAPPGERLTLDALVWGLPLLAPPTFALVGLLGLVALAPMSRTRRDCFYFLFASVAALIATVSSVIDHLRGGFENPWLWVPTLTGTFATVVAFVVAVLPSRNRSDLTVYTVAMALLLIVGPLGLILHVRYDMGTGGAIVVERFLRQAPVMAPMVFANMGLLGLLALLNGGEGS